MVKSYYLSTYAIKEFASITMQYYLCCIPLLISTVIHIKFDDRLQLLPIYQRTFCYEILSQFFGTAERNIVMVYNFKINNKNNHGVFYDTNLNRSTYDIYRLRMLIVKLTLDPKILVHERIYKKYCALYPS